MPLILDDSIVEKLKLKIFDFKNFSLIFLNIIVFLNILFEYWFGQNTSPNLHCTYTLFCKSMTRVFKFVVWALIMSFEEAQRYHHPDWSLTSSLHRWDTVAQAVKCDTWTVISWRVECTFIRWRISKTLRNRFVTFRYLI